MPRKFKDTKYSDLKGRESLTFEMFRKFYKIGVAQCWTM